MHAVIAWWPVFNEGQAGQVLTRQLACPWHALQERPEDVPTGELPRSMLAVVDRAQVGTVAPGTRVIAVGIYSTIQVHPSPNRTCPHLTPFLHVGIYSTIQVCPTCLCPCLHLPLQHACS